MSLTEPRHQGAIARARRRVGRVDPWTPILLRLARRIAVGTITLVLPDGTQHVYAGTARPDCRAVIAIRRSRAVRRLLLGGPTEFAEAFLDGDWDSPDLVQLFALTLANERVLRSRLGGLAIPRLLDRLRHRGRANTRRGSRRNIAFHYDLGNDFYTSWLDAGMTYSSALFATGAETLEAAQDAKYRRLAGLLDFRPGMRVLEIGCGWGGFATLAARDYGVAVTALTVSCAQADYARARSEAEGLADRVAVRLEDYRDVAGSYDRIVSVEMFEAVGEAYWPAYFDVVRDRLAPGGVAALQIITIDEARFADYRRRVDFIQRYIFPGGMLPSPPALEAAIARAGLAVTDRFTFGASYAETLALWRERFAAAWPTIRALGFDPRFRRLWTYYLAYCEAGFRAGTIDVTQVRIERP